MVMMKTEGTVNLVPKGNADVARLMVHGAPRQAGGQETQDGEIAGSCTGSHGEELVSSAADAAAKKGSGAICVANAECGGVARCHAACRRAVPQLRGAGPRPGVGR
jgi:hypothetical protein